MKIAICSNIAGAGKTSVANYLEQKYGFTHLNFADGIYQIAYDYFGMKQKNRALLIGIGEDLRKYDEYVWINHTLKRAKNYKNVVIGDLRKELEYFELIKNHFNPIRVVSPREVAIERLIKRDGWCDQSLLDAEVEIGTRHIPMMEIDNSGSLEDLYKQVDDLVLKLRKGEVNDM